MKCFISKEKCIRPSFIASGDHRCHNTLPSPQQIYLRSLGTIGSSSTSVSMPWWGALDYGDWCPALAILTTTHAVLFFLELCHLKHNVFQKFQVSAMESPIPLFSLILENQKTFWLSKQYFCQSPNYTISYAFSSQT